jgi:hypothetical protein
MGCGDYDLGLEIKMVQVWRTCAEQPEEAGLYVKSYSMSRVYTDKIPNPLAAPNCAVVKHLCITVPIQPLTT